MMLASLTGYDVLGWLIVMTALTTSLAITLRYWAHEHDKGRS